MPEITYEEIYDLGNLLLAWQKAKIGKGKKRYIKRFKKNLKGNLIQLQRELKNRTYNSHKVSLFSPCELSSKLK